MSTHVDHLAQQPSRLLLASQSPRRRRLLGWLGLPFSATAVETPEDLDSPLASLPAALAVSLAVEKAAAAHAEGLTKDALALCFDTIVVLDGAVLGKPRDSDDARRMLRSLSSRTHQVVTGVAMLCPGEEVPRTFSVTTQVTMRTLDEGAIELWMESGEFMGCAGAYNIEAQIAHVTEDECYQNVAGIPLCHLYAALAEMDGSACIAGLGVPDVPVPSCDAALSRHCRLGPNVTGLRSPGAR